MLKLLLIKVQYDKQTVKYLSLHHFHFCSNAGKKIVQDIDYVEQLMGQMFAVLVNSLSKWMDLVTSANGSQTVTKLHVLQIRYPRDGSEFIRVSRYLIRRTTSNYLFFFFSNQFTSGKVIIPLRCKGLLGVIENMKTLEWTKSNPKPRLLFKRLGRSMN